MTYYTNDDLDHWKENAAIYHFKWQSWAEWVDFHNRYCWKFDDWAALGIGDPDEKKVNINHLGKLIMRWVRHKDAWRIKKEKAFKENYPDLKLYVMELKK